ncbi:unnamed protein product [Rhizoctonia solani]|uniref:T6SS Phospholipase effector Tle1-like catalytic domain-containing protein n=1 Tax=Rhizoctonia solani TaxID=456999 RepID=A0A8H2WWI5_9AGAM|nr:unnamed protein product [Rhizoctonia solani]
MPVTASRPTNTYSRPDHLRPAIEPKDILVFMDGTGKDGHLDPGTQNLPTNVWRLYKLADTAPKERSKRKRICLYIPGIGSARNSLAIKRWLIQVYGSRIVDQVMLAWEYIHINYREGDRIYLFGYSRGAFAARKVASLLNRMGLSDAGRNFLEKWRQCERTLPWNPELVPSKPIPVHCIGVWDTVGAVYSPVFRLRQNVIGTPDTESVASSVPRSSIYSSSFIFRFPPNLVYAFHALAFHENRMRFRVNLFERPGKGIALKQVWFPGSHSDVGGGGKEIDLPKISLLWLLGELRPHLNIGDGNTQYPETKRLKPSDAYHESKWKQLVDRCETRLDSKALRKNDLVHISVNDVDEGSAQARKRRNYSLLNILDLAFLGLQTVALNQLERELFHTRLRKSVRSLRRMLLVANYIHMQIVSSAC